MDIKGDISLKYSGWSDEIVNQLVVNNKNADSTAIFGRTIDLFIVACSIGICDDVRIPNDGVKEYNSIGRNTYVTNDDVSRIFHFLFENAIITSKTVNFDIDTRLKLAFDSNFNIDKFSPNNFLVEFANYGIDKIYEKVTKHDFETINNLTNLIRNKMSVDYNDILEDIQKELDDLDFE